MDLTLDASDSNITPADCLSDSPQPSLSKKPKIDDDQNIDVTTEWSERPVEDERTKSKCFRIHRRCGASYGIGIGIAYHLDTADVNFVFDVGSIEKVVPAHKCMLAFHSPVFRQMLYGELKEKGDIKLTDTTVDAFIDLMQCMYDFDSTIEGSQSKIEPLLELAHKYDVNWVEQECQRIVNEIINVNVVDILWVLPLANFYSFDDLRQKCIDKIITHGNSIIESPEFVACGKELMKEIFGIDFVGRNEQKIFETCIKWAKRTCEKAGLDLELPENIREQLGDCFDLIRFESMTQEQLLQCFSINSAVFSPHEIQKLSNNLCKVNSNNDQNHSSLATETTRYRIVAPFNTIESSLQSLLEDDSTADVTFVFKNDANEITERIPAHKCILASQSKVLTYRFIDKTKQIDEIAIAEVSADVFMYFLRLIYAIHGNQFLAILKEVGDQHIDALLSLNRQYSRSSYWNKMYTAHLIESLNEQNVIQRFELAHTYSLDELKTKCVDFMKEKSEQIIKSEAFMDCSQENLKTILELRIWKGEKSLPDACIKWAKIYYKIDSADPKYVRKAMGDLFALIPFAAMDPMDLVVFQSKHRGIFTLNELEKLINDLGERQNPKPT